MTYSIVYSDVVIKKYIPKLSSPVKLFIQSVIEKKLTVDPVRFGKPLRFIFKKCRTLKAGDYRVIYQIFGKTVNILVIGHRKECYEIFKNLIIT